MKKLSLQFFLICIVFAHSAYAQWTTSGSQIYYNTGNVGIGTTSGINAKLHVVGPVTGSGLTLFADGGGDVLLNSAGTLFFDGNYNYSTGNYIRPVAANTQAFFTSGQERMRIAPTGNVGFGTIPSYRVHVKSTNAVDRIAIQGAGSADNVGFMIMNQDGSERWSVAAPYTTSMLQFYKGGYGNVMVLQDNGNVGIGTTSPNAKLDIDIGNSSSLSLALRSTNSSNHASGGLSFSSTYTSAPFYMYTWDNEFLVSKRNADGSWNSNFIVFSNTTGNVYFPATSGNVGIGTTNPGSYKLAVEGKIGAREVNVIATNPWPDYVFEKNYKLPSLEDIKNYIDQNKHLPEVPSAKEMEKNGVQLGEMNMLLLKKIEELTLYVIELKKKNEEQDELIKKIFKGN